MHCLRCSHSRETYCRHHAPRDERRYDRRLNGISRRCGFTLVEVVVGMVLLASLLVGVLQAYGSHHRQLRLARDRIVATQIADDMLTVWYGSTVGVPPVGRRPLVLQPGWWWQTQPVGRQTLAGLPVDVIRFDILAVTDNPDQPRLLSSVEVVKTSADAPAARSTP